ncbi:TauD/TfdA family dioxygenase [Thalassospira povalilytica]|uniref:TauD/TfdA family dioxygenase n=1 Tax=Thalassospira povalilytica TaxID=732237 RepID=UPI001D1826AD|nr:TauD/TfdA family dioxygenase [Thalassospira povalilytica]MCC4242078.1 TauD/TfdA family dioxygenase [Thalassospira povalilytica]
MLETLNWRGENLSTSGSWKVQYQDLNSTPQATDNLKALIRTYGFAVVTDVPVADQPIAAVETLFMRNILEFGCPVSQSAKLDFLGHVTDRGSDISNPKSRGYESSAELPFHTDRCDLLTLLCVKQAPIGGETRVVSAFAAYKQLLRTKPEQARILCEPVPFDLRDTIGSNTWAMMPVFSVETGTFVARYVRRFIEASQRFEDAPRLSDEQCKAFDSLDAILNAPGMAINLRLKPGEWLFIDNHRMLHARSQFQDDQDPAAARLLLRAWLCWSDSPELPQSFLPTYGRIAGGAYRGGVWPSPDYLPSIPSDLDLARKRIGALCP